MACKIPGSLFPYEDDLKVVLVHTWTRHVNKEGLDGKETPERPEPQCVLELHLISMNLSISMA